MHGLSAISGVTGTYGISGYNNYNYYDYNISNNNGTGVSSKTANTSDESDVKSPGRKSSPEECDTCKNRKYQDGSDEMVSFKSPSNISPQSAPSAVRSHEQEHVSNAYKKAAKNNGKVLSANVSIHSSVCPECGRSYVSGGTTSTQIKYYNEDNPYQKTLKTADAIKYQGMNLDMAV